MLTIGVIVYGIVKVSYFSQLIIHSEFIISLSPLESGFISSIWDAGSHGPMLLASDNAVRSVIRTLSNIYDGISAKIVNG